MASIYGDRDSINGDAVLSYAVKIVGQTGGHFLRNGGVDSFRAILLK